MVHRTAGLVLITFGGLFLYVGLARYVAWSADRAAAERLAAQMKPSGGEATRPVAASAPYVAWHASDADVAFLELARREIRDPVSSGDTVNQLFKLAEERPCTVIAVASIASDFAAVDGAQPAIPVIELAVDRAAAALPDYAPHDPHVRPIVDALWPLHDILWDQKQWELDQKLVRMLRPWEVYGSAHSQWASYMDAELSYLLGRPGEAYELFLVAVEERKHATEPAKGINRPLDYELGMMLFYLDRFAEAETHLRLAVEQNKYIASGDVTALLVISLVRQNKLDEARGFVKQFRQRGLVSVLEQQMLLELHARSEALARGRS